MLSLTTTVLKTTPVANTSLGAVRGVRLQFGVSQWLGLQYATAGRWEAPVDRADPYPADALVYGPNCPQKPGQVNNASFSAEECLYIQGIWAPRAAPAPVMLWINGGGFEAGGGADFNGSTLAARHGVLVLSINYRLGQLGFLALREDAAANSSTGNWGLLDQQAALRWVQQHVAAFGGDPMRVTIFGQSAGGSAVSKHLVLPGSRGLFHRAIVESGAIAAPQDLAWSLPFALTKADAFAATVGCAPTRECLLRKSMEELLSAQAGPSASPLTSDETVSAVVDGITLPAAALTLIGQGVAADVPLLLGANSNDSSLFVIDYPAYANMSTAQYAAVLNASLFTNGALPAAGALARLLERYPPRGEPTRSLVAFATDAKFICQARAFAAAVAHSPRRQAGVYLYHYDHAYPQPRCTDLYFDPSFGVTHTAEVSFVFGQPTYLFGRPSPSAPASCAFGPREEAISDSLGRMWAAFARDGAPHAQWPAYTRTGDANALLDQALADGGDLRTETSWRHGFCG